MGKKIAAYCRVASYDEDVMEGQKDKVRRFAEEQGIGSVTFYADNGYSGLNLNRPALERLDADMQGGKISVVIVLDTARVARNIFLAHDWMDKVNELDVKLIIVNQPDNPVQASIRKSLSASWRNDKNKAENF